MDSAILDVAIGLALLYLLLSLLVSLTAEFISRLLDLRANTLRNWIDQFLRTPGGTPITTQFYNQPLIAALKRKHHLPSYISSKTFATALLDLLLPSANGLPAGPGRLTSAIATVNRTNFPQNVKDVVIAHLRTVDGDIEKAREELALWFDGAMERVNGWYTRKMQVITLVLGAAVALIANADTLYIADRLWQDDSLRQATAQIAEKVVDNNEFNLETCLPEEAETAPEDTSQSAEASNQTENAETTCIQRIESIFASLSLPLLNHQERWKELASVTSNQNGAADTSSWLLAMKWLLGLVLTAAALSFGARFWFDALTKLVNIRLTGKPPTETK